MSQKEMQHIDDAGSAETGSALPENPEIAADEAELASRPEALPEHLWDEAAGCVRTDALIELYLELERTAAQLRGDVPDSPDQYDIQVENELFGSDPEVNRQLHAAGFSRDQVQLVYNLAAKHLMPMVADMASEFEASQEIARLQQEFGGEDQWREAARQIRVWGKGNLPAEVFDVLSTSREGITAMRKMMAAEEPRLMGGGAAGHGPLSEADLKQMMRDPRYWRDQNAEFIGKVSEGFRRIYDE